MIRRSINETAAGASSHRGLTVSRAGRLGGTLASFALLITATGCSVEDTSGRLLDQLCDSSLLGVPQVPGSACELVGDARKTTGVTDNSVAFELGPGGGALRLRLNAIGAAYSETWWLDVLAAAAPDNSELLRRSLTWGSCGPCPDDPPDYGAILPDNYNWVPVVDQLPGYPYGGVVPNDAYLELAGKNLHIIDIRDSGGIVYY